MRNVTGLAAMALCAALAASPAARAQTQADPPAPATPVPAAPAPPVATTPPALAIPAPAPAPAPVAPAAVPSNGTPATVLDLGEVDGVLGKNVRSTAGDDMGRIVDVIVGGNGQVHAAIIDFGGFLGVGSRKVAVDWRALQFAVDGKVGRITTGLGRNQIRLAPEYKSGEAIVVLGTPGAATPPAAPPAAAPAPAVPAPSANPAPSTVPVPGAPAAPGASPGGPPNAAAPPATEDASAAARPKPAP